MCIHSILTPSHTSQSASHSSHKLPPLLAIPICYPSLCPTGIQHQRYSAQEFCLETLGLLVEGMTVCELSLLKEVMEVIYHALSNGLGLLL